MCRRPFIRDQQQMTHDSRLLRSGKCDSELRIRAVGSAPAAFYLVRQAMPSISSSRPKRSRRSRHVGLLIAAHVNLAGVDFGPDQPRSGFAWDCRNSSRRL
jgi:hypothetical protein